MVIVTLFALIVSVLIDRTYVFYIDVQSKPDISVWFTNYIFIDVAVIFYVCCRYENDCQYTFSGILTAIKTWMSEGYFFSFCPSMS